MNTKNIRREFGQNYLIDPVVLYEMQKSINICDGDNFFEIGPGKGALTKVLNKKNITIIAMDIDKNNIDYLSKEINGPSNLKFVQGDILKESLDFLKQNKYRIVGNLPYNISTQIILNLITYSNDIIDAHFLVQKEVAQRITGSVGSKNWGKLGLKLSAFFDSEILFDVSPTAFDIKPKVTSSFIRMSPKNISYKKELIENFFKVVDMSFASRRKNIKNNLKNLNICFEEIGIDQNLRPEEIDLSKYFKIANIFKD